MRGIFHQLRDKRNKVVWPAVCLRPRKQPLLRRFNAISVNHERNRAGIDAEMEKLPVRVTLTCRGKEESRDLRLDGRSWETATFVPVMPPRPRRTVSKSKHGCGKRAGVRCFPLNSADGEDRLLLDSQFNPSARRLEPLAHISAGEGADLWPRVGALPPQKWVRKKRRLCSVGGDRTFPSAVIFIGFLH